MPITDLNFTRQLDVYNPVKFERLVHVIGVGAVGSNLIETLIRSGISNIHAYDHDDVADVNIPNQAFRKKHIGLTKVAAMVEVAVDLGAEITPHHGRIDMIKINSPCYLVLAVDSMSARKSFWDKSAKYNPNVRLIEGRMAAEHGIIHCINPMNPAEIKFWEDSWFSDEKAEESSCTNKAVATTAREMAARIAHYIIMWEKGDKPHTKTLISMAPAFLQTKNIK